MGPLPVASHDRTTVAPVCVSCDCGWVVIILGAETEFKELLKFPRAT